MSVFITTDEYLNWQENRRENERLQAENARLRTAAIHIYNSGYHAGHHDTVEGRYVDIYSADMDSYHAEEVGELLEELLNSGEGE